MHAAVCSPFPKCKFMVKIVKMLCRKGYNMNDKNKEFVLPLQGLLLHCFN